MRRYCNLSWRQAQAGVWGINHLTRPTPLTPLGAAFLVNGALPILLLQRRHVLSQPSKVILPVTPQAIFVTIRAVIVRPQVDPPPRSQSGITDWWKFKDLDSISEEDKLPPPYRVVLRGGIMDMWLCSCESQWDYYSWFKRHFLSRTRDFEQIPKAALDHRLTTHFSMRPS